MERIDGTENEYRRVKSDDYIMSDEVVHEPIISDELFEAARRKGRRQRQQVILELEGMQAFVHLVFLKCPMWFIHVAHGYCAMEK